MSQAPDSPKVPAVWRKILPQVDDASGEVPWDPEETILRALELIPGLKALIGGMLDTSGLAPVSTATDGSSSPEGLGSLRSTLADAEAILRLHGGNLDEDAAVYCLVLCILSRLPRARQESLGVRGAQTGSPFDDFWVNARMKELLAQRTPKAAKESRGQMTDAARMVEELGEADLAPDDSPALRENIRQILLACSRERRRAVVLLAPPGGGKTFAVVQLAHMLKQQSGENEIPDRFRRHRIFRAKVSAIVSNQPGRTAENLEALFRYLGSMDDQCLGSSGQPAILFFDEFHALVQAGHMANAEIASSFKELLTSDRYPNLTVITATTKREYDLFVRADPALERRLTPIHLKPMTSDEIVEILLRRAKEWFKAPNGDDLPEVNKDLMTEILGWVDDRLPSRPRLDAALDLLDGARARRSMSAWLEERRDLKDWAMEELHYQMAKTLPVKPSRAEARRLKEALRRRVTGQVHAVDGLVDMVNRLALGLGSLKGPEAVVLLTGPRNSGKGHLCRSFAEELGGRGFLEIRMQELGQDDESLRRLVGSQASYKRSESGGLLVNFVRDHPDGVVLVRGLHLEPDKPLLEDFFASVLSTGLVQDGFGNRIDVRSTIFVFSVDEGSSGRKAEGGEEGSTVAASHAEPKPAAFLSREEVIQRAEKSGFPSSLSRLVRHAFHLGPLLPADLVEFVRREMEAQAPRIEEATGLRLQLEAGVEELVVCAAGRSPRTDHAREGAGSNGIWEVGHLRTFMERELWGALADKLLEEEDLKEFRALRIIAGFQPEALADELHILLLDDKGVDELESLQGELPGQPESSQGELPGQPESSLFALSVFPGAKHSAGPSGSAEALLQGGLTEQVRENHIILLDLNWGWGEGHLDGIAILKLIRNEHPDPKTKPVLLYTHEADSSLMFDYWKEHATGFVEKGNAEKLKDGIRRARLNLLMERAVAEGRVEGIELNATDFEDDPAGTTGTLAYILDLRSGA